MYDRPPRSARGSFFHWIAGLSSRQQLTYGCVGVIMVGTFALYCAGTLSLLVRPILFQMPPTEIPFSPATPLPTRAPVTLIIPLPQGTVPKTPTQAPIPTRVLETTTPTLDLSVTPSAMITATTGTPRASATSNGKSTATPTRR